MITQIFGLPGAGKTALLTKLALDYMTGYLARQDLKNSIKVISQLNAGGFDFTIPDAHLVYVDYGVTARHGAVKNHEVNGFELGLFDANHFTRMFPPCARFFLDEAQKYLNSRERTGIADSVSRFYELHRHNYFDITLVSQRPGLIDKNVRELSEKVLFVYGMEHTFSDGRLFGTRWHCLSFETSADAIAFCDGKRPDYVRESYSFIGNIFKHYSSHYHLPAFYKAAKGRDFAVGFSEDYKLTVDDIQRFNNSNSYLNPIGYFKKR